MLMVVATSQEDPVLTAYVRHVVIGIDNLAPSKLAKEIGIAAATVVNLRDGTRGVGFTVAQKIARARFNNSFDALKRAAHEWAEENPHLARQAPTTVAEHAARYGSREAAIQTHVRYAEHDEATIRAAADGVAMALHAGEDPGERWWYEQIDAELKRRARGRPRLGEREISEEDEAHPQARPRRKFEIREGHVSEDLDKTLAEAAAALSDKQDQDGSQDSRPVAKPKRAPKARH